MYEKNLQSVSQPDPELLPLSPDQPAYPEDPQLEIVIDPDFRINTRSLSEIKAHERLLNPIRKEQEVRQKIRKVQVQRRAAGDPTMAIRQVNKSRRR